MAAETLIVLKEVKDITECPICTEMFCKPKMLPCFHTFCLKCMEQYCKDKEDGVTMPCPMCRKEFIIPTGGLSKLSANFFIDRLIEAQSQSEMKEVVNCCDVCLVGKRCTVEASSFCMECQENMCDPCSSNHKSMKMSMNHHIARIGDPSAVEAIQNETQREFCDKHPQEEIKFFCRDCKIPCCTACFIAKHNKHDCCEIEKILSAFKKMFKEHSDEVSKFATNIKQKSDQVDEQFALFSNSIDTAEMNILERSEAIKRMVDKHAQALIAKLGSQKIQCLKNILTTKEELQRSMMMCDNFVSCCQKAILEADAVKSFRIAEELRTRAEELKKKPNPEINKLPDIQFHQSDFNVATKQHNIVGKIHVKHSLEFFPHGFAICDDELFCVNPKSSVIRVYNIKSFALQRKIPVEGMKRPYDIVASEDDLYVGEYEDKLIHRIQLPENNVSNWSLDGTRLKLSITKNGNVIVASGKPAKIFEYTSVGNLVRKIAVDKIATNPICLQHAIRLKGDKFLVCHTGENTPHRVCIIDSTGRLIKCFEGNEESGMGELYLPVFLVIYKNGSILVADKENSRIVQLDASLKYMNEFTGFGQPRRLLFAEEVGRLYVLEGNEQSITILDM